MTRHAIVIRGERYVTLAGVAETYEVELAWVREVYDWGLLGEGEHLPAAEPGDEIAIAETLLDRVARIRRLHLVHGANLPGIALMLDLLEHDLP